MRARESEGKLLRYSINGAYRKQYSTKLNDTFDLIAFNLYGDEKVASYLIAANPQYANVLTFEEGVLLTLPKLELLETSSLPRWKGGE